MSALTSERVWSLDGVSIELAGKRADMLREKQIKIISLMTMAWQPVRSYVLSNLKEFLAILKADY